MLLKAMIFDVDGTLAETERDGHRVAFNLAFQEFNLDWNWEIDLYGELLEIAGGKERIKFYIQHYQPDFIPPISLDKFIPKLHQTKTKYYAQLLSNNSIKLRPGVKRLISQAIQKEVILAIASTAAVPNVISLIQTTLGEEALSWFEVIAAGDMVERKKPAPDIYLYVLEKMALNPEECIVIEDSHQGLLAAKAANLKTVITVNEYTKNQDFTGAFLVLNHLGEPDLPFTVLQGNANNKTYFDLDLVLRDQD
jgi:beta-phosphoglucomutase-like phosphatase (HAD superfamily)